jgi:hypothetical protein
MLPYQISLQIQQAATGTGYNQVTLFGNYIATCTNKRTITLYPNGGTAISLAANNTTSVTLPFYFDETNSLGPLDVSDPSPIICTINSGQIQLTDTSGSKSGPITRQLQGALALKFKFPHVKPTVTLTYRGTCSTGKCDMIATFSGIIDASVLLGKTVTLSDSEKALMSARIDTSATATFTGVPVSPGTHSFVASIVTDDDLSATSSNSLAPVIVATPPPPQ